MSRRVQQMVPVQVGQVGQQRLPVAFTWRGVTYRVQVISQWRLATRWWDTGHEADWTYYRVETADRQVFELYCDAAQGHCWVLDIIQD